MADFTNRNSGGGTKVSGSGAGRDFTNRYNNGSSDRSNSSKAPDLTNASYGAKAPRSKGFTTVVKNKSLAAPFHRSDPVQSTPRPFTLPGAKRGRP